MKPTAANPRTTASVTATSPIPDAMRTAFTSFVDLAMISPVLVFW
jgi:hypothetical protein